MQKILLVHETYGDLVQLESMLKKLGFDVVGMQNSVSLQEQLLGYYPDVVVLTGRGSRVNGLELSQRIKKRKGLPKIALMFPQGVSPSPAELANAQMDAVFELPIDPVRFLTGLCKLTGQDAAAIMEKFARLQGLDTAVEQAKNVNSSFTPAASSIMVTGGKKIATPADRSERYKALAAQIELPGSGGFSHDRIQAAAKEIKRTANTKQEEELDADRRAFVRALFKKNK